MKRGKSGFRKQDYRALRAIVLLAVLLLGAYTAFFRLGVEEWHVDELVYRDAGKDYVWGGDFQRNLEHPFLVKYILGVTQVVLGSSEAEAVRIPAATAALLTGLILFAFARRVAGYWTGVVALALWTISPLTLVYGRLALLEIFIALFSTLALYLGWRWAESRDRVFAASAGVAIGLATASKIVGILFLPAILFAGLLKSGISRRFVLQSLLIGLAAAATVLATYIPIWSGTLSAIQYMFEFQAAHGSEGHPVHINGELYSFPPWWAHLWWQWQFYGTIATLSLGVAVGIAFLRRRPLELYLLVAALVPFLFLSFCVQFKLPHYFCAWQPPLILLLALVAGRLGRRGIVGGTFAILLLAPFAYLGVEAIRAASHVPPNGFAAAAEHLENTGHDQGPILVWGHVKAAKRYFPDTRLIKTPEEAQGEEIEAVLVDTRVSSRRPDTAIQDYLAANREEFSHKYQANSRDRLRDPVTNPAAGNPAAGDIEVYARGPGR